jgi:hypothetical protein
MWRQLFRMAMAKLAFVAVHLFRMSATKPILRR